LLYDLNEQRRIALERVLSSIDEMEEVKRTMTEDAQGAYLVDTLLNSLRRTKARLESAPSYGRRSVPTIGGRDNHRQQD